MPTIHVYWLEGRSAVAREKVVKALSAAMASVPEAMAPSDHVDVWFFDVPVGYLYSAGRALPAPAAAQPHRERE
jgi:phenylpyruvate tautomerase PptA (4-oxalocrotonate tautomerase family)